MPLFQPNYYVSNYQHISIPRLKKAGIKLLLCDVDNTLVASHDPDGNQKVVDFVSQMQASGIAVAIVSNARKSRIVRFSKHLGIDEVYWLSLKPFGFNIKKAMKKHGVTSSQTAIIGDQLFTDMLGGNLAGIYTILTHPISVRDKGWTKVNRKIENMVFRHWKKKGCLEKGVFDD